MRIGFIALLLFVAASITNASVTETIYDDSGATSKSVVTFKVEDQTFINSDPDHYWDWYRFDILSENNDGVTFKAEFVGTPSSDQLTGAFDITNDGHTLIFYAASPTDVSTFVQKDGGEFTFSFEIAADEDNVFGVQLSRTPHAVVPEPATVALTVMGAGLLLRRKF